MPDPDFIPAPDDTPDFIPYQEPKAEAAPPEKKPGLKPGFHASNIPTNIVNAGKGILNWAEDQPTAIGLGKQMYKRFTGQPNTLDTMPEKAVQLFAAAGIPEEAAGEAEGIIAPRAKAPAIQIEGKAAPGRAARLAQAGVEHVPGYKLGRDILDAWRGPEPKALPAPAAPENPMLGKGKYGTPIDLWGSRVETKPAIATPGTPPIADTDAGKNLQGLLEQSMGGRKLEPAIPLREQMPKKAIDIPEGHQAVESSALQSYKYDPGTKEFHAKASSGDTVYVYGDVSPEEAAAFDNADSKGKAWQVIRRNPLVAKIVNGKRIAVKP